MIPCFSIVYLFVVKNVNRVVLGRVTIWNWLNNMIKIENKFKTEFMWRGWNEDLLKWQRMPKIVSIQYTSIPKSLYLKSY
jgi:hypothetical protein